MIRKLFALAAITTLVTSCVAPDTRHHVIISVPQQRMALLDNGVLMSTYPISTSKFAIGDWPGSRGTPLGELEIAEKIGGSAPSGSVFKDRKRTGEILEPDAPGRDPIVTRILWLRGREAQNANAYSRNSCRHSSATFLRSSHSWMKTCAPDMLHLISIACTLSCSISVRMIFRLSISISGRTSSIAIAQIRRGGEPRAQPWKRHSGVWSPGLRRSFVSPWRRRGIAALERERRVFTCRNFPQLRQLGATEIRSGNGIAFARSGAR